MTFAEFVGQALLGWIIADLVGGVVHWVEDRLLTEHTPFLGQVSLDNQLHHREPMAFTAGSAIERSANTVLLSFAIGAVWLAVFGWSVALVFAIIGGSVTNEVHAKAHQRTTGWLRVFQDTGIIQSTRHHTVHHRPPQMVRYCILTDWCNPILDALDFWGRLERLLGVHSRPTEQRDGNA